jgi:hypothetical protein
MKKKLKIKKFSCYSPFQLLNKFHISLELEVQNMFQFPPRPGGGGRGGAVEGLNATLPQALD